MTHLPNGGNRCVRASAVLCGGNAVGVLSPVCRRQLSPGLSYHRLDVGPEPPRHAECFHEDRKSTRLNSSHRTISYAVFCLKKKKNKDKYTIKKKKIKINTSSLKHTTNIIINQRQLH